MARSRHMSTAEWVRRALDFAKRREPLGSIGKKLEVIRAASQHDYPVGDLDGMLAETGSGYGLVRAHDSGRLEYSDVPRRRTPSAQG